MRTSHRTMKSQTDVGDKGNKGGSTCTDIVPYKRQKVAEQSPGDQQAAFETTMKGWIKEVVQTVVKDVVQTVVKDVVQTVVKDVVQSVLVFVVGLARGFSQRIHHLPLYCNMASARPASAGSTRSLSNFGRHLLMSFGFTASSIKFARCMQFVG